MGTRRGRATARTIVAFSVAASAVLSSGGPTGADVAGRAAMPLTPTSIVDLPVEDARSITVDPGTGRVFVAGDDQVAVRTAAGAAVATISGMTEVSEVVAGAGAVFALLPSTNTLVRIDPATAAVTNRWSLAPYRYVSGLAVGLGRVWTTGRPEDADPWYEQAIMSVHPTTGVVSDTGGVVPSQVNELAVAPGPPAILVVGASASNPGQVDSFAITATTATPVGHAETEGYVADLALASDGGQVIVSSYADGAEAFALPGLEPDGVSYPTDQVFSANNAVEVADTSGTDLVLVGDDGTPGSGDLRIYRRDQPSPLWVGNVAAEDYETIIEGGVAWGPGGSTAYAVRWSGFDNDPAQLLTYALGPRPTGVSPRVVGVRGGGTITVQGAALGLTSVQVGGKPTTGATGATTRTVTVPALPVGPAPVVVTNAYGMRGASPVPVVVRELGPFRGSGAFADRQYRDFAGRAATGAEGLAADGQLAAGTSAGALPVSLARSVGFADRRAPIVRLYQAIFLRPPDTAGFEYWLGRVRAGRSLTWVASAMANAPEFKTRYGSLANGAFVDRIYSNVLGRPADASGKAYWVGQLNAGKPRGTIVVGFSQSPEYRAKMADQVDVTHLYLGMLRRTPTATELAAALATTQASAITSVAVGVLTSTEYRSRIG